MSVLEKSKKTSPAGKKKGHTSSNPRVRLAAVEKLDDPEELVEVAPDVIVLLRRQAFFQIEREQ